MYHDHKLNTQGEITNPIRIQRKRTKGWKIPTNSIYVGRPTLWGNPCIVGKKINFDRVSNVVVTPKLAVLLYKTYIEERELLQLQIKSHLKGKNLACWCPLNEPCHADILLKIANSK